MIFFQTFKGFIIIIIFYIKICLLFYTVNLYLIFYMYVAVYATCNQDKHVCIYIYIYIYIYVGLLDD
jgi:hypothetical protein